MSKPRILKGKVTFVSLLTIAFLLCFITTVQAFPQLSLPKNELKFGVREIVPPVKEFCEVFGITLSKKLNDSDQPITVQYSTFHFHEVHLKSFNSLLEQGFGRIKRCNQD